LTLKFENPGKCSAQVNINWIVLLCLFHNYAFLFVSSVFQLARLAFDFQSSGKWGQEGEQPNQKIFMNTNFS